MQCSSEKVYCEGCQKARTEISEGILGTRKFLIENHAKQAAIDAWHKAAADYLHATGQGWTFSHPEVQRTHDAFRAADEALKEYNVDRDALQREANRRHEAEVRGRGEEDEITRARDEIRTRPPEERPEGFDSPKRSTQKSSTGLNYDKFKLSPEKRAALYAKLGLGPPP